MFTLFPINQKSMLLTDFQHKLRKIDSKLYVKTSVSEKRENGYRFSGLYKKIPHKQQVYIKKTDRNLIHAGHEKFLNAVENGDFDTYVTAVCIDYIPEYDVFNKEYTKLAIKGWRSIALDLVRMKLATLEKVRKVFRCPSLGESDYDKAGFFGKLEIAKKVSNG